MNRRQGCQRCNVEVVAGERLCRECEKVACPYHVVHNGDSPCNYATPYNTLGTYQRINGQLVNTYGGVHHPIKEPSRADERA